ncbi:MAG: hypothetical protein MJ237_01830 [bacterium]|nr:hypothetical protein [bacterium]
MGFLDRLSRYADVIKLGLTKDEAKKLDELDGEKDNKYEGRSLFDVVSEYKEKYDNGDNKNIFGENISLYNYICSKLVGTISFTLPDVNIRAVHLGNDQPSSANEIADDLVNAIFRVGTGNLDGAINQIGSYNIIDVLSLYQEKANKKNSVAGIKFDKETLFEAILDENISNEKKKEYLNRLTNSLLYSLPMENDQRESYKNRFDEAINSALSKKYPFQSSKEIDAIVKEIIDLNRTYKLKSVNEEIGINGEESLVNQDDILGNGKIDNPAVQLTGNCRAHSVINGILATEKGAKYLNSLIHKDKSTGNITVYLPGGKRSRFAKTERGR